MAATQARPHYILQEVALRKFVSSRENALDVAQLDAALFRDLHDRVLDFFSGR